MPYKVISDDWQSGEFHARAAADNEAHRVALENPETEFHLVEILATFKQIVAVSVRYPLINNDENQ